MPPKLNSRLGLSLVRHAKITAWPLSELAMTAAGTVLVPTRNICRFFNQSIKNSFQARLVTCRFSHCKAGWLRELKTTLNFQAGTSRNSPPQIPIKKELGIHDTNNKSVLRTKAFFLNNIIVPHLSSVQREIQVKNHLYLSATWL